jgi:branched-chain amino acid transport system substrate-binding protein
MRRSRVEQRVPVCGRDDAGGVAGKYLAEHFKGKNVAIVHDKTLTERGRRRDQEAMNAAGLKGRAKRSPRVQGFLGPISKMKQSNIDAIYFGGYQTEAGLIVRQARSGLAGATGADALVTEEF